MMLLSINIPTYNRLQSFSSMLTELARELDRLDSSIKALVQINISDNDSDCYKQKALLCKELEKEFNIHISIKKNDYNDGVHMNVHNCYVSTPNATFTWVLGDDDHVVEGALEHITNILLSHKDDLGLLILSGGYTIHSEILKNKYYDSYYKLAIKAVEFQPHFLIAHTLISSNIYRTNRFIESESLYTINSLYSRYGHWTGFPHMRGLISGLLRTNNIIIVSDKETLDTGRRVADVDLGTLIFEIYYFYFLWLLTEIGIRPDQVKCDESMHWFRRGLRTKIIIFRRRLKVRQRLRQILIKIVGEVIFNNIRDKLKVVKK
jgi:hypothetical protein